MENIAFYFLYSLAIFCALGVVLSSSPVHAILFLVMVFLNCAALLVLAGSEFLGLVLIVVYVGAVTVLFLFVCMMLDLRVPVSVWSDLSYLPLGSVLLGFFLSLVSPVIYGFSDSLAGFGPLVPVYVDWATVLSQSSNIVALASVLYSVFSIYFILSAYILLVAMIGSISLTLWKRLDSKRQSVYVQVNRNAGKSRVLVP